ncbi:NUDIX hydrolase [Streptomyces sp. NBC_00827]|uniref:NUDIX hydrolase n=1 Tax=Streptomyces sp. NBC_00827 TaxID=2903677 RepID=UPI003865FFF4|nr:NUDIX domain-containing protein [Streptomyces sp. NBC_00827]
MTTSHAELRGLLEDIEPWDDLERTHLQTAGEWIASGAPLYRTRKPDVPATHLVAYFVVLDERRRRMLLVAHRKAGLWLPTGGHVEPGEHPWTTVVRECAEELRIPAVAAAVTGEQPLFLTVTRTRGPGEHADVSFWYVLDADADSVAWYDEEEFTAIRWLTPDEVLAEPPATLDPHLHRFTRKLARASLRG